MQDAGVAHRCVGTRIRPTAEESFRAFRTDADAARRRAATLELISDKATALSNAARGELATKVRYFGGKSTNVPRGQMGTKPAKVAHRPSWPTKAAKLGFSPETEALFAKRSSLRGRTKVAKLRPPRARGQIC